MCTLSFAQVGAIHYLQCYGVLHVHTGTLLSFGFMYIGLVNLKNLTCIPG